MTTHKLPMPEWTLFHMLLNTVDRTPDKVAVIDGERHYTYSDLLLHSSRFAGALRAHGLGQGDRVGVYLEKSWPALVAILACVQAGAVFVNINPLLKHGQVAHIVNNCSIRHIITDNAAIDWSAIPAFEAAYLVGNERTARSPNARIVLPLLGVLEGQQPAPPQTASTESDLGSIIYTSGSTGMPKGIMLTHHNLVVGAQIVSVYLENTPDDRVLSVLPLNFDVGLNQFTTMLRVGGTLVLQRSLMPGDILRNLRKHAITGLAGVPGVWSLLLQNRKSLQREPLASLRYISNTGGMIPQPHLDELRALLRSTQIYLMYGLTEAFRSTYCPPSEIDRGSACIGKAIPNTTISLVTQDGRETAADEVGELIHRGPTVALGYWGDDEKTKAVYRVNPFAPAEMLGSEMVVYSGDLVRRDRDGFLYYVGRRDEQIKTHGYRVSPLEIEELVQSTGFVQECAAFGKKDDTLGQRLVVVASLKQNVNCSPEDIRAACADRAPSHLVPQEIYLVAAIPKNANGKIDRSLLKHDYATN